MLAEALSHWYLQNYRPLPWRADRDPYKIWISEVMLQQTTVTAVVPYYERFMNRFPNLKSLAEADTQEVLKFWSGLGYYSRARNLHKAAQILMAAPFPQKYAELLKLPGFGPYTARAVSSLAFNEAVGVLDGNVIRVLSRLYAKPIEWWTTSGRQELQGLSDALAQAPINGAPEPMVVNQALMELGATICTPQSPRCGRCPWNQQCQSWAQKTVEQFPLKRARKKIEFWLWKPQLNLVVTSHKKSTVSLVKNDKIPFLKGHYIFEGEAQQIKAPPKKYDVTHSITHHKIFVQIQFQEASKLKNQKVLISKNKEERILVPLASISEVSPSSLIQKIINTSKIKNH